MRTGNGLLEAPIPPPTTKLGNGVKFSTLPLVPCCERGNIVRVAKQTVPPGLVPGCLCGPTNGAKTRIILPVGAFWTGARNLIR